MWLKWILLFIVSSEAWGYRLTQDFLNGFYWASLPINITVLDSDPNRKGMLERMAKNAINEWESRTGLSLWDFSSSGSSAAAGNVIRWSNNFGAETRMDPNSVLAVAIRYAEGPYFARTEIIINGAHYMNYNTDYLQTTLVHELGHTLGVDHSEVQEAVMAPTLQTYYNGLHTDDVAAMSEAHSKTHHRQLTGYISPLSYTETKSSARGLSCGTIAPAGNSMVAGLQGILSLVGGILISFIRKVLLWFKSKV